MEVLDPEFLTTHTRSGQSFIYSSMENFLLSPHQNELDAQSLVKFRL